jgi:hypothetical protein
MIARQKISRCERVNLARKLGDQGADDRRSGSSRPCWPRGRPWRPIAAAARRRPQRQLAGKRLRLLDPRTEPDSESRPASSAPARLGLLLRCRQQPAYRQLQLAQRRASTGHGAPATPPPAAGTDLGKRGCTPRSPLGARGLPVLPRSRRLMANWASERCRSLSPLRPLARARSASPMTPATSARLGRSACEGAECGALPTAHARRCVQMPARGWGATRHHWGRV